ncbi:MAG: helix-hairpin-helix domain-containing protein [Bacteroides sp.]|nr:helix-hairpin-helix domain-containing protein [Bacteroides sp.]
MWREYLYFTRRQRRGIWILITLIILCIVTGKWIPTRRAVPVALDPELLEKEYADFMASLKERNPESSHPSSQTNKPPAVLFPFDPNRIDSLSLTRLGLPGWMARNVIRYRESGGRFRDAESFRKIYGMTDEFYHQLLPFIHIETEEDVPDRQEADTSGIHSPEEKPLLYPPTVKYPEGTVVDLNSADTTVFKHIPGIGSGIARQIVSYRQRLGGFHSTEQLLELEHIDPDMLVWFTIETDSLRKIQINRASVERLRAHPYLNFYQAKTIVEHRRKRGNIKDIQELRLYEEFTPEELVRIAPYLSYE